MRWYVYLPGTCETEVVVSFNHNTRVDRSSGNPCHENSVPRKVIKQKNYSTIDREMLLAPSKTIQVPKYLVKKTERYFAKKWFLPHR